MSMKNCPLPSEVSEQRQTSRVGSPEPASHGRWMLRICSVVSGTAPGELGARVLSLKQPVRAARWRQRHRERSVVYVQTAQRHTEAVLFYCSVMLFFFFHTIQQHFGDQTLHLISAAIFI